MSKLSEAFALAHEFHATQLRKSTNIPYISHLMSVSALVMEHGGDQEQAIAALLHDAVEDADTTDEANYRRHLIKDTFGERVAMIVEGCTDGVPDSNGVKPDWQTRKHTYLVHLEHTHSDTLLVSCADKLHNARAILGDYRSIGDEVFGRFNAGKEGTLWYYQELARVFDSKLSGAIAIELNRTVTHLSKEAK